MALTREQFDALSNQGFSVEEIAGFEQRRANEKLGVAFLPKLQETEQKIAQRPDAVQELFKEVSQPWQPIEHPVKTALRPLVTGMKAINVPLQRGEAILANIGLAEQRGATPQEKIKEALLGLFGKRQGQFGDIVRTTGFGGPLNEPLAAATGLGAQAGLGELATRQVVPTAQKVGQIAREVGSKVSSKLPKIMGERWFENEAKLAQKTASGLEGMRSAAYENVYNKIGHAEVDPMKIDAILRKYDLVDELGSPGAMDIKSAKIFSDELRNYIPKGIQEGKVYGKGGFANPQIRATKAAEEIKNVIYQSADEAEKAGTIVKGSAQELKDLDKLSYEKLYPRAEKIRKIGGYSPEPETSGVSGAYKVLQGSEGSAGKRLAIKRAPEALKEVKKFIPPEKQFDLTEAIKNAEQLKKNMGKYRGRQITKAVTGVTAIGGLGKYLADRLAAKQVLR